jgi:hypothetical protein
MSSSYFMDVKVFYYPHAEDINCIFKINLI